MEEGILCRFTFVKCMMIMMTKRVMIIKTLMQFSRIMKYCQIRPDYCQAISLLSILSFLWKSVQLYISFSQR